MASRGVPTPENAGIGKLRVPKDPYMNSGNFTIFQDNISQEMNSKSLSLIFWKLTGNQQLFKTRKIANWTWYRHLHTQNIHKKIRARGRGKIEEKDLPSDAWESLYFLFGLSFLCYISREMHQQERYFVWHKPHSNRTCYTDPYLNNKSYFCWIWRFYGGDYEHYYFLGYYAMYWDRTS
jgi:hypothetical protein